MRLWLGASAAIAPEKPRTIPAFASIASKWLKLGGPLDPNLLEDDIERLRALPSVASIRHRTERYDVPRRPGSRPALRTVAVPEG
jgi:hypothetical protein